MKEESRRFLCEAVEVMGSPSWVAGYLNVSVDLVRRVTEQGMKSSLWRRPVSPFRLASFQRLITQERAGLEAILKRQRRIGKPAMVKARQ